MLIFLGAKKKGISNSFPVVDTKKKKMGLSNLLTIFIIYILKDESAKICYLIRGGVPLIPGIGIGIGINGTMVLIFQ